MVTYGDVRQIAGLLEGEGSFLFSSGTPRIQCAMTDLDVIETARRWMGHATSSAYKRRRGLVVHAYQPRRVGAKMCYSFRMCGPAAAGWMMMLYQFMGARRRAQIVDVLAQWRVRPVANSMKTACVRGHRFDVKWSGGAIQGKKRDCSQCNRDYLRAHYAKLKVLRGNRPI